ncbi:chloride channel protein [Candidatus Marsarchaeota G2 archaeon OSP_D]|jgi:Chloride channel protein EriC|uniref:Chloride channel protein n=3 Tax=Candidatus Marsarchaeota group 2 TaxID=2203771 RepID=A0A2R6C7E7_9ARCH|nr:MAG: chloride channel protein [Candidatus Marsarchaeota G2 archaeon OSP_D]PSN90495.1 MAG: chloride channel protein [Candidatus Marsarchaeota G2 archaeon ECH_B_SAG-M15]PSO06768.1 MAG: chloride channel protein [Candidatus Marsarchaeota G2 archaeon BE_D]
MSRLLSLPYFEKWLVLGVVIGIMAGLGAMALYFGIKLFEYLFLDSLAGARIPHPVGEGGSVVFVYAVKHPYALPLVVGLGGLISGLIVYTIAPEAEGHGTDAAIDAYHNKQGKIRRRIPFVKLVASAITIGSGGSAGREGPTAQLAAGIGSAIADMFHLSPQDRRIAVAVGIGAGIGTIFKAPIGGAVLAAEVLYRRDLEPEVIFPAIVASSVGYSIFASIVGFEPIFGYYTEAFSVLRLPFYAILGLAAGGLAIVYVRSFYGVNSAFKKLRIPPHVKPMIGGVAVGLIALVFPEVMATGYGWVQLIISGNLKALVGGGLPVIVVLALLPFIKIIATSMSVGSGGSGGVFAPGMVIGASLGGFLGLVFHILFPSVVPSVAPFAIVGMLSFFGAAGKVPLSVILMVVEMTGSLQLLPAAMLATAISYTASGLKYSIYRSQVNTHRDSPAHMGEYNTPLLSSIRVSEIGLRNLGVRPEETVENTIKTMNDLKLFSLPVVDGDRFIGVVYLDQIVNKGGPVYNYTEKGASYVKLTSTADQAWDVMMKNRTMWCPVVENGKYLGSITLEDILREYRKRSLTLSQTLPLGSGTKEPT